MRFSDYATFRETCAECGAPTLPLDPYGAKIDRICVSCAAREMDGPHGPYESGYDDGKDSGYDDGYEEGHDVGYEEGRKSAFDGLKHSKGLELPEEYRNIVEVRITEIVDEHKRVVVNLKDELYTEMNRAERFDDKNADLEKQVRENTVATEEKMGELEEEIEQAAELLEHREADIIHLQGQIAVLKKRLDKCDA